MRMSVACRRIPFHSGHGRTCVAATAQAGSYGGLSLIGMSRVVV